MTKYHLFGFLTEIDEESTRSWYAASDEWSCDCGDCRNFLALARERQLPALVLEQLDKLGIPPEKAPMYVRCTPKGMDSTISSAIALRAVFSVERRQKLLPGAVMSRTRTVHPAFRSRTSTWNFGSHFHGCWMSRDQVRQIHKICLLV